MPKTTLHTEYHKDGSVWAKGKMIDGECDGYWEWWRRDGTKMRSGNFDHGKQVGEWITYDKKGAVYKKTLMKDKGKLTICSRGHKFYKSKETPVCPKCWPGKYSKQK